MVSRLFGVGRSIVKSGDDVLGALRASGRCHHRGSSSLGAGKAYCGGGWQRKMFLDARKKHTGLGRLGMFQ